MPGCDCCNVCVTGCGPNGFINPPPGEISPRGIDLVLQDLPSELYVAYIYDAHLGFTVPSLGVIIKNLDTLEGTYTLERGQIQCPQSIEIPLDISQLRYELYAIESSIQFCPVPPFLPLTIDRIDIITARARLDIGVTGFADFGIGFNVNVHYSNPFASEFFPFRLTWEKDLPPFPQFPRCDTGPLLRNLSATNEIRVMIIPDNCPSFPPPLDDNSFYEWIF